jgi:hypothetical protein
MTEPGGWKALFADWSWVRGEGRFPIAAYSEYMPPPRVGQKPYGNWDLDTPFSEDDPWGWRIAQSERDKELTPGRAIIARQLIDSIVTLATGKGQSRIGRRHLENNPYWPKSLASAAPAHERYLFLSPLALSKTQDDKGRVRWTLFGGSQMGPAQGFWKSFFSAPSVEMPADAAQDAIRQLLAQVYGDEAGDLRAMGFRIMPTGEVPGFPESVDGVLPSWTKPFLLGDAESVDDVRYLLTFRPFSLLPEPVQRRYLAGELHLLPCPGSLVFWGSPLYQSLDGALPFSCQILLQQAISRHASPRGIRVPQSGWLHDPAHCAHDAELGEAKRGYRRVHRWQRMWREGDSTTFVHEDPIHKVLFSALPDDVGLYGKPMARNAQIWSKDFRVTLDGPNADGDAIRAAIGFMANGDSFGYRFFFPPMQAGRFAIFWHRPLMAFRDPDGGRANLIESPLRGYLTATDLGDHANAEIELWPRFPAQSVPSEDIEADAEPSGSAEQDAANSAKRSNARARKAAEAFARSLGVSAEQPDRALTYDVTAMREFEVRYWETIASLAEGRYLNKNAADCSLDPVTQARIAYPERDLDQLGDFLLDHYRKLAADAGMSERVLIGEFPFRWQTDFDYPWMEGWLNSQTGHAHERNLVVVIPGKNRNEAVIMADHYDTAYMEDVYGYRSGKNDGARVSASGADDNHSATSSLMLGAEIFMELSRAGKLARDIWLVHLTGEEFPSDCLGARDLAQKLVEGTCKLHMGDQAIDLSGTRVCGLYVADMIAHNNDRQRDIFQIAPGGDRLSLWLAYQAHVAAKLWEAGTLVWNGRDERRNLGRGRRSPHGGAVPLMARHLAPRGEVRFRDDPRSTLFNTDGQIFSDAGIPTVLFMENYDINREGYHDTQDTMANIDLDYGAAVASILIESVARAASEALPDVAG